MAGSSKQGSTFLADEGAKKDTAAYLKQKSVHFNLKITVQCTLTYLWSLISACSTMTSFCFFVLMWLWILLWLQVRRSRERLSEGPWLEIVWQLRICKTRSMCERRERHREYIVKKLISIRIRRNDVEWCLHRNVNRKIQRIWRN